MSKTYFAAVGDVHGQFHKMVNILQNWEKSFNKELSFVLQVGDFEPHRTLDDLRTMSSPQKYRKLGDFKDFYSGKSSFPWQIWFIGGNHEPYGFLDQFPNGATITENCNYIGRVGLAKVCNKRILGMSGIFRQQTIQSRPSISRLNLFSNKDYIGFTEQEIFKALEFDPIDILLLHEWPSGIASGYSLAEFNEVNNSEIGNEYFRYLIELLKPKTVFCGHMHVRYETQINFDAGSYSDVYCLANISKGTESFAVFEIEKFGKVNLISSKFVGSNLKCSI